MAPLLGLQWWRQDSLLGPSEEIRFSSERDSSHGGLDLALREWIYSTNQLYLRLTFVPA